MIICFFSLAGHFLMMNAQFLAVVHVIVYTGAIMVLLLFTLMLMNLGDNHETKKKIMSRVVATLTACLLAIVLLAVFLKASSFIDSYKASGTEFQSIKVIGRVLLDEYLVPFEFTSILLLTAMIGSILISKRNQKV
jgi:NADH:ubiquinone oxidoreductase subunit 6 (chain J)